MRAAFPSKPVAKGGKGRAKLERPKKKKSKTGMTTDEILMKLQQVLVLHEHSCRRVRMRRSDPHHLRGEHQIWVTLVV